MSAFLLQTLVFILSVYLGLKYKGIATGLAGSFGLAILVFVFRVNPDSAPLEVSIVIISMMTATGALEAADGLRYFIKISEKLIRKYPSYIVYLSPILTFLIGILCGTGHTVYALLPIISKVSQEIGIRPEKPLSVSVIAAQQVSVASPISVHTVLLLSALGSVGISVKDLAIVYIPATLVGIIASCIYVSKKSNSYSSPDFIKEHSLNNPHDCAPLKPHAQRASVIFLIGIITLISLGSINGLRPKWNIGGIYKTFGMTDTIVLVMLSVSLFIVMFCKVGSKEILNSSSLNTGLQASLSILGVAWLGMTYIRANEEIVFSFVTKIVSFSPYTFAILLFLLCIPLLSQSTATRLLVPIGLGIGMDPWLIVALVPAVNSVFVLPNYPTIAAAVALDNTGSTKAGKYIFDHSFFVPGMIATIVATLSALVLVFLYRNAFPC